MGNTKSQKVKEAFQGDKPIKNLELKDDAIGKYNVVTFARFPNEFFIRKQLNPTDYED